VPGRMPSVRRLAEGRRVGRKGSGRYERRKRGTYRQIVGGSKEEGVQRNGTKSSRDRGRTLIPLNRACELVNYLAGSDHGRPRSRGRPDRDRRGTIRAGRATAQVRFRRHSPDRTRGGRRDIRLDGLVRIDFPAWKNPAGRRGKKRTAKERDRRCRGTGQTES